MGIKKGFTVIVLLITLSVSMWAIITAETSFDYWLGRRPYYIANQTDFILVYCKNGENIDREIDLIITLNNATLSDKSGIPYEIVDEGRCSLRFEFLKGGTRALSQRIFFDIDENSDFFSISVGFDRPEFWHLFVNRDILEHPTTVAYQWSEQHGCYLLFEK